MKKANELTDDQIWKKTKDGDSSILSDSRVSTLRNGVGNTPLHWLADRGAKKVLKHPGVSTLKNEYGNTPLHFLAGRGVKGAWFHPDFDKVKNKVGKTPKDWWFLSEHKLPTCIDVVAAKLSGIKDKVIV